jgi:hypothetical protein
MRPRENVTQVSICVDLPVVVAVGQLVQRLAFVGVGPHHVLHAVEVRVDLAAEQDFAAFVAFTHDREHAADVGLNGSGPGGLVDLAVRAALEVAP